MEEFRRALDTVYGSAEAATAAVRDCTDISDTDKELLANCSSSDTTHSAEVIDTTN
jgi:hypothetical protein